MIGETIPREISENLVKNLRYNILFNSFKGKKIYSSYLTG